MIALASFIKNPKNTGYEGEDNDEHILYVIRRSLITNLDWVFLLSLMAIAPPMLAPFFQSYLNKLTQFLGIDFVLVMGMSWYLAVAGLWLFKFLNWFFNVYIISNKKIIDFDFYGLTYKNISDTLIMNVEDVTAKINGPLRMIFNIGDVFIQTAAENREFDFMDVDDPGKIRDIISDLAAERIQKSE